MTARLALSPDEIEERWPRCRAAVPMGDVIALVHGRIVGRTTESSPRVDIRDDAGTLHRDIPAARIVLLAPNER